MFPRIRPLLTALVVALTGYAAERELLPIMLFENSGQAPADVRFVLQYQHLKAYYRNDSVLFRDGAASITMRFRGESPSVRLTALEPIAGRVNFLRGNNSDQWIRDLKLYSGLAYRGLYRGVDLVWRSNKHVLKSEFVVAPGADVHAIKLAYSGKVDVSVGESGCLLLRLASGTIREDAPVAYTIGPRGRTPVRASFRVAQGQVGFDVGPYDRAVTLVID